MFSEKTLKIKEKNKSEYDKLFSIKQKSRGGAPDFLNERVTTLLCVRVQMYYQIFNLQVICVISFHPYFFRTQLLL